MPGRLVERVVGSDKLVAGLHTFLPDGRLIVAGGHISDNKGIKGVNIFDWTTNSWADAPHMRAGRWYPTATVLPNGWVPLPWMHPAPDGVSQDDDVKAQTLCQRGMAQTPAVRSSESSSDLLNEGPKRQSSKSAWYNRM